MTADILYVSTFSKSSMKIEIDKFGFNNEMLFVDTGFAFSYVDKISISGANGSGKSTLLNILSGKIHNKFLYDATFPLGYFGKNTSLPLDIKVKKLYWQFKDFLNADEHHKLIEGFAFGKHLNTVVGKLSEGNLVKSQLIFLLSLKSHRFLLLDEPTEFIDDESLIFLANYLKTRRGGHVITSHNKIFLKETCSRHFSIHNQKLVQYVF